MDILRRRPSGPGPKASALNALSVHSPIPENPKPAKVGWRWAGADFLIPGISGRRIIRSRDFERETPTTFACRRNCSHGSFIFQVSA
ncbi:hypothetical protein TNCV_739391 [Trichonephila clavipes]|nr:hypothetical protein TNCV_739391 [Trichonephila clavipes]